MAMVGTLISVEEYLHTTYDPDCDYVDGEVLERNMGDQAHSTTQVEFAFYTYYLEAIRLHCNKHITAYIFL